MTAKGPDRRQRSFLAEQGWLSLTPQAFRARVLDRVSLHSFKGGDPVYRINDPPGGLWAIVNGSVEAEMPGATGPSLGLFATPGFWFGEGTVIFNSPRRVGVFAASPSTLAHLSIGDCRSILSTDPGGWRWIALLSTINMDRALRLAADLLLRDPEQRTAATLLRVAGLRGGLFLKPRQVPVTLSHEKLGRLANLSRNAISPILQRFERKRLIRRRYRTIEVLDAARLSAIVERSG